MVSKTVRDDGTWYECDSCGMLFEAEDEALEHERHCEGDEETSYIQ